MKLYKASKDNSIDIVGTFTHIAKELQLTKQYVNRCFLDDRLCKGYHITFYENDKNIKTIGKRKILKESIELLKRAKLIIEQSNGIICENGDSSINIKIDIDRFLNIYKII